MKKRASGTSNSAPSSPTRRNYQLPDSIEIENNNNRSTQQQSASRINNGMNISTNVSARHVEASLHLLKEQVEEKCRQLGERLSASNPKSTAVAAAKKKIKTTSNPATLQIDLSDPAEHKLIQARKWLQDFSGWIRNRLEEEAGKVGLITYQIEPQQVADQSDNIALIEALTNEIQKWEMAFGLVKMEFEQKMRQMALENQSLRDEIKQLHAQHSNHVDSLVSPIPHSANISSKSGSSRINTIDSIRGEVAAIKDVLQSLQGQIEQREISFSVTPQPQRQLDASQANIDHYSSISISSPGATTRTIQQHEEDDDDERATTTPLRIAPIPTSDEMLKLREVDQLQSRIEDENKLNNAYEEQINQQQEYIRAITEQLRSEQQNSSMLREELESMKAALDHCVNGTNKHQQEREAKVITKLKKELETANMQLVTERHQMQAALEEKKELEQTLREQIQQLEASVAEASIAILNEQEHQQRLLDRIQQQESEIQQLKERLADATNDAHEKQMELDATKEQLEEAKKALASATNSNDISAEEVEKLHAHMESMQSQFQAMRNVIRSNQEYGQEIERRLRESEEERLKLLDELSAQQSSLTAQLSQEVAQWKARVASLESQLAAVRPKVAEVVDAEQALTTTITVQKQQQADDEKGVKNAVADTLDTAAAAKYVDTIATMELELRVRNHEIHTLYSWINRYHKLSKAMWNLSETQLLHELSAFDEEDGCDDEARLVRALTFQTADLPNTNDTKNNEDDSATTYDRSDEAPGHPHSSTDDHSNTDRGPTVLAALNRLYINIDTGETFDSPCDFVESVISTTSARVDDDDDSVGIAEQEHKYTSLLEQQSLESLLATRSSVISSAITAAEDRWQLRRQAIEIETLKYEINKLKEQEKHLLCSVVKVAAMTTAAVTAAVAASEEASASPSRSMSN